MDYFKEYNVVLYKQVMQYIYIHNIYILHMCIYGLFQS